MPLTPTSWSRESIVKRLEFHEQSVSINLLSTTKRKQESSSGIRFSLQLFPYLYYTHDTLLSPLESFVSHVHDIRQPYFTRDAIFNPFSPWYSHRESAVTLGWHGRWHRRNRARTLSVSRIMCLQLTSPHERDSHFLFFSLSSREETSVSTVEILRFTP